MTGYAEFLSSKRQLAGNYGFDPIWMPDFLFDFQQSLVEWAIRKGRAAIFADCGLGKTPMQLVWAQNIVQKTNRPVLILTPLAVSHQTAREAEKFGIEAKRSQDGQHAGGIVITNYERLHHFEPADFVGVVCDESSILKSFSGSTRKLITRFMAKLPYRLLCTATAAPNDYIELGTSSEALGELTYSDMLIKFFKYLDDKGQRKENHQQEEAEKIIANDGDYYAKLAYRVAQTIGQWRLKHHAVIPFWRWVASWARACRMPSDLGFDDGKFQLPPLNTRDHIIHPQDAPAGKLFNMPAVGLAEERAERTRCLDERCQYVADLVKHDRPALIWCQSNGEGDLLEEVVPNALQVAGRHDDDYKIAVVEWFVGEKCICNDPMFRAKLATWKQNQNARPDIGLDTIRNIVSNALLYRTHTGENTPMSESPILPPITEPTNTSTKRPRPKTLSDGVEHVNGTQRTPSSAPNASERLKNIGGESPRCALPEPCGDTGPLLKIICDLPHWDAQSAEQKNQAIQEVSDFISTMTTLRDNSEDCCVLTAILGSESLGSIRNFLSERRCICGYKSGNRKLISKAKIFGFGCNFQHCNHVVTFASHSYEQYYQSVRRCWRFGQERPVTLDVVATVGEIRVLANMRKKAERAAKMFEALVREMNNATSIVTQDAHTRETEIPSWL